MLGISSPPPSPLLDQSTVLQVSDGSTRFYAMPFDSTKYMWQLSWRIKSPSSQEREKYKLKQTAIDKCKGWKYAEDVIRTTSEEDITGYPVYDRDGETIFFFETNLKGVG